MDDLTGLVPLNLRDGAVTAPFDLTAGQAARAEALDADDQLAALHEAGHAVMACVANSPHDGSAGGPPFPVSAIDIKSRRPRVELAEEDDNMPRWHTASRYRALIRRRPRRLGSRANRPRRANYGRRRGPEERHSPGDPDDLARA